MNVRYMALSVSISPPRLTTPPLPPPLPTPPPPLLWRTSFPAGSFTPPLPPPLPSPASVCPEDPPRPSPLPSPRRRASTPRRASPAPGLGSGPSSSAAANISSTSVLSARLNFLLSSPSIAASRSSGDSTSDTGWVSLNPNCRPTMLILIFDSSNAAKARTNAYTWHITSCTASTLLSCRLNCRSTSGLGRKRLTVRRLRRSCASLSRTLTLRPIRSTSKVESAPASRLVSSSKQLMYTARSTPSGTARTLYMGSRRSQSTNSAIAARLDSAANPSSRGTLSLPLAPFFAAGPTLSTTSNPMN
mmetsp:Transcript_5966/g.14761  ORF Transcript_5966/g.14761 Transcript_5966/m.14761 type:complete len:303 (+) Transcript_5966:384-1292(+)